LQRLDKNIEEVLSSLTEEQLAIESPSRNPRFGTKPLSFIVDHLLVEHAAKHCGQIKRNLSKIANQLFSYGFSLKRQAIS
jgi:hypothetical protein